MKKSIFLVFTVNALMAVALILTACGGGKDGGKNWDEQIDGSFAADGLFYEAQLTDVPESPLYSAKEIIGYWKGAVDRTIIVFYQDNSYKYSMVVYEVGKKTFQEVHEMVQGEREGIPVFYDKKYDKYYVWQMQENVLEHRSKTDIKSVVETYPPVVWRTEESLKAAGIAAIATRKGFGPIKLGNPFGGFPDSVEGLYDSCESYEEVHDGNNDDEGYEGDEYISAWTEKYWRFSKEGKEIFRVYVERAKITRYVLLEGSKHIQTVDGIYAGMPIRELYEHIPNLAWESDELSGNYTAWNNNFIYGVHFSDIEEGKFPQSADDFKADAVLRSIDCSNQ